MTNGRDDDNIFTRNSIVDAIMMIITQLAQFTRIIYHFSFVIIIFFFLLCFVSSLRSFQCRAYTHKKLLFRKYLEIERLNSKQHIGGADQVVQV